MSFTIIKLLIAALAASATAAPQPIGLRQPRSASGISPIPPAPSVDFTKLLTQPTLVDRFKQLVTRDGKLLPEDELRSVVSFDFNTPLPAPEGKGGAVNLANTKNWPILAESGLAVTVGFLGPCGINTPHVHPRATELLTVASGSEVDFGYILENGLVDPGEKSEIAGKLGPLQATLFPMGSIHFEVNPTCDDATFISALNNDDPGVSQVAQNFFGLDGETIEAVLGFPEQFDGDRIEEFRSKIPANVARGIEQCLEHCKIPKRK
ncbi:RmlC-like cupin [Eremomyces bilateralis CBS 781.70]|uniref:RmlC-like cupin n=1 Tax=Eremomyces bilateralis CBS 781.70 TaxID=1392243 RepID=A0A6G1FU56_9PEZI|nr:RmlC-like cupin [Eremomyces bilateralis CBS 781.70]KAF1809222.1 RmlC-like cupin [Eremomyces bilateralis CBS 781.70]